jgi:hypothetical protein
MVSSAVFPAAGVCGARAAHPATTSVMIVINIFIFILERLAFYAMCGKYRTIGNSAQANILPHVA